MQGFIFGAGFGVRLRPLTDYRPKVAVPVLGEPIICHVIDRLQKLSTSSIIINTHYNPTILKQVISERYPSGSEIFYSHEPVILETGGGLFNARNLVTDQTFVLYNGDIYSDLDLNKMIEFHKKKKSLATLAVAPWCEPRQISYDQDNRIVDIRQSYTKTIPTHTFMGIHILEKDIFTELAVEADRNNAFSIIKTYLRLIKEKKPLFAYEPPECKWFDIGSLEVYKKIHKDNFDEYCIEKNLNFKTLKNNKFEGYFYSGNNCVIKNDVTLRNVILWDNVKVEPHTVLEDVIVTDSKVVSGIHKGKII